MSCGVRKLPIGGLSPDINNALLVAVIIAKRNVKTFLSKKDSDERGVWNLTLRDSIADTINATVWGSSEFATCTHRVFNIGDVVEILNPRVLFKQSGSSDALFSPAVSSPFQLHLQENVSEIFLYSNDDVESIRDLVQIPTKSPSDFLRLSDVFSYGQAMKGEYVNLLVAVRSVEEIKNVTSKRDARNLMCRHITVMDQSHLEFHITLWDEDIIQRSDHWRSKQTIIFFADVRLEWDNYRHGTTAIITSRTVVTENPKTTEALALRNFAKSAPTQPTAILDHFANNVVDANRVHAIMTTAQVLDKAYNGKNLEDQFTAIIFVNVTSLNLDGLEMVQTYAKMSDEEKTALKWKLLLTHCEARILVLCTSPERPQPLISLLRCKPTEIKDVASKLPIY